MSRRSFTRVRPDPHSSPRGSEGGGAARIHRSGSVWSVRPPRGGDRGVLTDVIGAAWSVAFLTWFLCVKRHEKGNEGESTLAATEVSSPGRGWTSADNGGA